MCTKTKFSLILLLTYLTSFSQNNTLTTAEISSFAYSFEIKNGKISGAGADTLQTKVKESQFFMLGEEHFSPQISQLTNNLLPIFATNGYKNFALEIGPHSAKIIEREIKTHNSLFPFNHSFHKETQDIPFPFFDGTEDEVFIKTAIANNFKLWGLDQEYLTSSLFMIDEIYNLSDNKKTLNPKYTAAKKYIKEQLEKLNSKEKNDYFKIFDFQNPFTEFINLCKKTQQKELIDALQISMNIYQSGWKGNEPRMEYMKRNFSNYYKSELSDELPKVFIKMGSMHLGRGKSWLGIYDLGNMISEMGYFNNTKTISINCFSRYIENEDGSIYDFKDDDYGKNLSLILDLATKNTWTLVDNKRILEKVKGKKITLHEDLEFILSRYDYILFAPVKTKVKYNY